MKKVIKNGLILAMTCAITMGGANIYAQASGNVKNVTFRFKADTNSFTDTEYKSNKTRTYAIVTVGDYANVTLFGGATGSTATHICSKENLNLHKYKEYTIRNLAHYNYIRLRLNSTQSGYGLWSPDSTKDYNNIG